MLLSTVYIVYIYILFIEFTIVTVIAITLFIALIIAMKKLNDKKNTSLFGR